MSPDLKLLAAGDAGGNLWLWSAEDLEASFADRRFSLARYNVWVNDVPIYGAEGKPVSGNYALVKDRVELTAGNYDYSWTAALNRPSDNIFQSVAFPAPGP